METSSDSDSPLAPDGTQWWRLKNWPNSKRKFGGENRTAAWLWFNIETGESFTMRQVRAALGDTERPDNAEQLSRRVRRLRESKWIIHTHGDDSTVPVGHYRLKSKGLRVWLGEKPERTGVSAADKRIVFERDGSRCTICGVGRGESYPNEPGTKANLTVGHRLPQNRGGARGYSSSLDNLRTECRRCNEPIRDRMPDPERPEEVAAEVRHLRKADKQTILEWLEFGERKRPRVDVLYDRIRNLAPDERGRIRKQLERMVRGGE